MGLYKKYFFWQNATLKNNQKLPPLAVAKKTNKKVWRIHQFYFQTSQKFGATANLFPNLAKISKQKKFGLNQGFKKLKPEFISEFAAFEKIRPKKLLTSNTKMPPKQPKQAKIRPVTWFKGCGEVV